MPDGLAQSKLMSFIVKFPHLEKGRGAEMDRDVSTLERGGGNGAPNVYYGVSNVDSRMNSSLESESQKRKQ